MKTLPLVLALPLAVLGCASPEQPKASRFRKVEKANDIPGLADRMKGMIGRHFFLDTLPEDARTLESAYPYLSTKTDAQLIRERIQEWETVYGGELAVEHRGGTVTVLVYSGKPDLGGPVVYSVSEPGGYPWQVYLGGP